MGRLLIGFFVTFFSCGYLPGSSFDNAETNVAKDNPYAQIVVNAFELSLVDRNGACILTFNDRNSQLENVPSQVPLDMASPCDFLRKPGKISEPQMYSYGNSDKRMVLMVVGGEPDTARNDEIMPNGCGTRLKGIRVFDSHIEVTRPVDTGYLKTTCPTWGLDEIFFAGVAFP